MLVMGSVLVGVSIPTWKICSSKPWVCYKFNPMENKRCGETGVQISEDDAKALEDLGYLRIENGVSPELLTRLQALADQLEADAVAAHHAGADLEGCWVTDVRGDVRAYRVDDIVYRDPDAVLDLLASPALMAIADQLSGPRTVPLNVDIVYKHPYPYPHIIWHQGAPHPRTHPYFNIGVYLDDSDAGDGCLRYVPRTQHELLDIGEISGQHGWNPPDVVELPAKAGDILVQDMMILHASEPKRTPGARRTVYIEF